MKLVHSLFVSACVLAAAGCSSTSDTTDGGTSDGGGDTLVVTDTGGGGDTTPTDTPSDTTQGCGECAAAHCNDKVNACVADTQCAKDVKCINDCKGSASCDNVCVTQQCGPDAGTSCPPTDTLFGDLITCLQTSCNTACFGKT